VLDHIGFGVSDFARSKAFYAAALAPLGYRLLYEVSAEETGGAAFAGFGGERPQFWIGTGTPLRGVLHAAFMAKSEAEVRAFYEAALAVGARDNGAPGLRPHYHRGYFGAFVLDPDGHNVEGVWHGAAGA
jgi:catechol 2,3-dioxygenase-like lactoylglutathione lyase family enzyme